MRKKKKIITPAYLSCWSGQHYGSTRMSYKYHSLGSRFFFFLPSFAWEAHAPTFVFGSELGGLSPQ